MSKMAKEAREAMKKKVTRLVEQADPKAKVDGSSYEPPEMLDADVQTGMRPISRRQFRRGGVVTEGEAPKKRADKRRRRTRRDRSRDQYKNGGSTPLTSNSLVNKDMKEANEERDGKKHIGGLKKGGRAERASGGSTYASADDKPRLRLVKTHADDQGRKAKVYKDADYGEYRVKFFGADGKHKEDADYHTDAAEDAHGTAQSELGRKGWKKGGRAKRAAGGMGSMRIDPMQAMMAQNHPARRAKDEREQRVMRAGRKTGGRTGKSAGGIMEALSPAYMLYKNRDKDAVKGLSPIANMKSGGTAHPDVKMDTALIKKAVHKHEEAKHPGSKLTKLASGGTALSGQMQGTRPTGGRIARASGGLLKGHPYHDKTDAELRYIVKDAGEAARAMKGVNEKAEAKYLDQVNDASSILNARKKTGRLARKDGGTVTNIYFDSKKPAEGPPGGLMPPPMPPMPPLGGPPGAPPGLPPGGPPMPPPHMGPPPGGPPGLPPGGPPGGPPMMRRAGGRVGHRTYRKPQDMDAGAGSGLGRLEKIQIQKGK